MKREDKTMDLKGRHFLTLKDFTPEEIIYLLDLAAELKEKKKKGILVDHHRGKNVALIFEKDSTRTRSSFEIAAHDLGMGTTYIGTMGSQFGKKESIKDTARVLGRMYEGIEYTLDFTRPFGDRVTRLDYHGKPVQPTDELEVVANQYRAVGGGNYSMFKPEKIVREVQIDMTELIAEYLRKHPVIEATVNNNFKTVVK